MAGIYWAEGGARVRAYSAIAKSTGNPIVKVEIEILDTSELGYLLEGLKAQVKPSRPGRSKPLMLEDLRGRQ
ncbi:MAG: hypothetical protein ABS35_22675 [Kaistia sp. SCN 65-12]|nr:MAG: hypothetical protein ABS35_22675 [Kaistia sp. SCN 65-12]